MGNQHAAQAAPAPAPAKPGAAGTAYRAPVQCVVRTICVDAATNGDAVLADGTRVCGLPLGEPHPRRHLPHYERACVRA